MAIIRSITQGTSNVGPHSSTVDATVQIIDSIEYGKLIHLATYGSDLRKSRPKVSQVIQLDKERAQELANLIIATFGEISS